MKYNSAKSEIASIKLVVGMAVFGTYYGLGIYIFHGLFNDTVYTIAYALTLIPAGNFVLSYVRRIRHYREHLKFLTMFYQKTQIVNQAKDERKALISFLNQSRETYMRSNSEEIQL